MKTNKLLNSLLAVFTAVVLFTPHNALAAAFGVSPPWIENDNLKPGSNFVYVINLSANDLPGNMVVDSVIEGDPEIAQWLTVQNKDKLIMTTGESIVPMSVNVRIPEDAKVGKYEGNLKLSLVSNSGKPNSITTLLGGNIAVKLGVINYDVTDYTVQEISAEPITEGQPITLQMNLKNQGNTEITDVTTKTSVIDISSGETIASGTVKELNLAVQPQTKAVTELTYSVPGLQAGNYWLDVEAFKNDRSAYTNRLYLTVNPSVRSNAVQTGVDVMPEGWVKPAAEVIPGGISGPNATVVTSVKVRAPLTNQLIMVIIGILLVLTGIVGKFYFTFKKRRH